MQRTACTQGKQVIRGRPFALETEWARAATVREGDVQINPMRMRSETSRPCDTKWAKLSTKGVQAGQLKMRLAHRLMLMPKGDKIAGDANS